MRITFLPLMVWDSIRLTLLTVVLICCSEKMVICFSKASGGMPTYCQISVTIGSEISGKMSFGMRRIDTMPSSTINSAMTTNVYGRLSASLTIHKPTSVHLLQQYCFDVTRSGMTTATKKH